jgi:hypothetical protein
MPIAALFVTHEKKLFRCYAGFGGDGATRASTVAIVTPSELKFRMALDSVSVVLNRLAVGSRMGLIGNAVRAHA